MGLQILNFPYGLCESKKLNYESLVNLIYFNFVAKEEIKPLIHQSGY